MKRQKLLNLTIITIVCVTILLFFHYEPKAMGQYKSVVNSENSNRLYITGKDTELLDEYNMALLEKEYQALTDQEFIDAVKSIKVEEKEIKATVKMSRMSVMEVKEEPKYSEKEIEILERIVEAEATSQGLKGKIHVAHVVLNRVNSDEFPDTIEEVVFQKVKGVIQFSPIADGRYFSVDITKETKKAVKKAIDGKDTTDGALYFSANCKGTGSWIDRNMNFLFSYKDHDFYK